MPRSGPSPIGKAYHILITEACPPHDMALFRASDQPAADTKSRIAARRRNMQLREKTWCQMPPTAGIRRWLSPLFISGNMVQRVQPVSGPDPVVEHHPGQFPLFSRMSRVTVWTWVYGDSLPAAAGQKVFSRTQGKCDRKGG